MMCDRNCLTILIRMSFLWHQKHLFPPNFLDFSKGVQAGPWHCCGAQADLAPPDNVLPFEGSRPAALQGLHNILLPPNGP